MFVSYSVYSRVVGVHSYDSCISTAFDMTKVEEGMRLEIKCVVFNLVKPKENEFGRGGPSPSSIYNVNCYSCILHVNT